jgi:exopolysaccharide biosynthesis polyprenyl glycosylphosphotransferase
MTSMLGALIQAVAAVRPLARRTVILGTGPMARTVAREIASRRGCREAIVGVVAEAPGGTPRAFGSPVLGALGDLDEVLRRAAPGRVIVALRDRRGRLPVESLLDARVRGVAVQEATEVLEHLTGKIAIEAVSAGSLAFSSEFRGSRLHDALARALGVLVAGLGLVLMAPLLALIAIAIRLDSPGPILFVQEREGLRGRTFRLLKFRTMHDPDGPTTLWARDNGDRITRIGRWLRRFRLDELPQFVNVLRGDMNLIGPRPQPLPNCDLFSRTVPYYRLRSAVRPGVTGWAQVRYGYANDLEEETEKMRYDLYYIKHRSVWLDVRILLDTVRVVLLGGGAEAHAPAASFPARVGSMAFLPRIQHRHLGRSHRLRSRRDPLGMLEDPHQRPGPRFP